MLRGFQSLPKPCPRRTLVFVSGASRGISRRHYPSLSPVVQELQVAPAIYHTQCLARVYSSHIIPALYRKSLTWITNPMVDPKYAGRLNAGGLNRSPTRGFSHQQVPERCGEMSTREFDGTIAGACCDCFWRSPARRSPTGSHLSRRI